VFMRGMDNPMFQNVCLNDGFRQSGLVRVSPFSAFLVVQTLATPLRLFRDRVRPWGIYLTSEQVDLRYRAREGKLVLPEPQSRVLMSREVFLGCLNVLTLVLMLVFNYQTFAVLFVRIFELE